jgi:hypothetical protein
MLMNKRIASPKLSVFDRDRGMTCQDALEPCFHACIDAAGVAGWTTEETAFALLNLSLVHLKLSRTDLAAVEAIRLASVAAFRTALHDD